MQLFLTGLERRHVCRKERGSDSRAREEVAGCWEEDGEKHRPGWSSAGWRHVQATASSPSLLLPILSSSSSSSCFFLPAPPGGRRGAPTSPALISRETSGKQLWLQMGEPQQFSVRRRLSSAQRSSRCSSPYSTGSSPQLRVPMQPQQQIETFPSTSTATADMGAITCSTEIASSLVGNLQLRGLDLHSCHILYQLPLVTRGYQSHLQINTLCNTVEADFIKPFCRNKSLKAITSGTRKLPLIDQICQPAA